MINKDGRTTADEAVEHQTKGAFKQVKGRVKEAFGALTGDGSTERSGMIDRVKGRVQEEYGKVKEKEASLENDMNDLGRI